MAEDPALQNVISEVSEAPGIEKEEPAFYDSVEKESKKEESLVEAENRGILEMRKKWADHVLLLIYLIALFDIALIILYGVGALNFKDPRVVIVVVTENFLKIIGLGVLITHNIFKKIF